MGQVPGFAHDVFISYSHLDDQAVSREGWVTSFNRQLQIELDEELGRKAAVWCDARIGPADDFAANLEEQLRASATVLAVVSPAYLNSEWCDWELRGFVEGPRRIGELMVGGKSRAVKVVKRPGERESHRCAVLAKTTGAAFFEVDERSKRHYELDPQTDAFQRKVADLAHDLCQILRMMRRERTVYLGAAPPSLATQRAKMNNELEAKKFIVLSAPADATGAAGVIRSALEESSLSIHFVEQRSDSAAAETAGASSTEWQIAKQVGGRQVVVVRDEQKSGSAWNLSGENVEVLVDPPPRMVRQTVLEKLESPPPQIDSQKLVRVYLVCESQDHPLLASNLARTLRDHLMKLGFEVKVPLAEGSDAAEFSRDNRTKLRTCQGVLIYWGGSRQGWFEQRLYELTQALGWRKGKPFAASAAYVARPPSPVKENYETREVEELIKQFDQLDPTDERLLRFIAKLKSSGASSAPATL